MDRGTGLGMAIYNILGYSLGSLLPGMVAKARGDSICNAMPLVFGSSVLGVLACVVTENAGARSYYSGAQKSGHQVLFGWIILVTPATSLRRVQCFTILMLT